MNDLQAALAAATPESGVTAVWVAAGNYTPSANDATVSFVMRSGLGLYGGFGGTETSLLHAISMPTPRSSTATSAVTTSLEAALTGTRTGTSSLRTAATSFARTARTRRRCSTASRSRTARPDPPVANSCSAVGSTAWAEARPSETAPSATAAAFATGGGMYLWNSNASVTNCRFIENYGHLADCAGLFVGGASQPVIEDCLFQYNVVAIRN